MSYELKMNPCKCGSKKEPNLDSDDMVPCWMVTCLDCGKSHHATYGKWTAIKAVEEWNKNNPE